MATDRQRQRLRRQEAAEDRRRRAARRSELAAEGTLPTQRVRRAWLVQLAAWTRSWPLLQWAGRQVRIEHRQPDGSWRRVPVHVVISPNGDVRLEPDQEDAA